MWRLLFAWLTWAGKTDAARKAWKRERRLIESLEPVKDVRRFQ